MALRHGPVPPGRIMFAVSANEAVALAEAQGLRWMLNVVAELKLATNRDAGATWSRLAFTSACGQTRRFDGRS